MHLIGHNSIEEAKASAVVLAGLGSSARKLLAEVVEKSSVKRAKISKAAKELESAGFLFIRDHSNIWDSEFEFSSSLLGEEALEILDDM